MLCPQPQQLQQLLDESLPVDDQQTIQTHLEDCAACQQALERLAAGSITWDRAAENLATPMAADETAMMDILAKLQQPTRTANPMQADTPFGLHDDDLSFLQPMNKPGVLGRLDRYEIHSILGKGGFGIVLKAFDETLHRVVAIKIMTPHLASNGAARQRFDREAKAAAAVTHENVVHIYEVRGDVRIPYLVMQLVGGRTLADKVARQGALSVKEILRIGGQTAEGLAAAHKQGLVHRDIKPGNILLENSIERVKLTDFGLARAVDDASVTQSGTIAGTPMFMSPEQANGDPIDHRSDLFSLGSVLYVMATGRPPFRAASTMAVMKRVCDDVPTPIREVNPDMPDWLIAIIAKLHAKKAEERFQTAKEVAELLSRHLADVQAGRAASDVGRAAGRTAPVETPATVALSPLPAASTKRGKKRAALIAVGLVGLSLWTTAYFAGPFSYRYLTQRATIELTGTRDFDLQKVVLTCDGVLIAELDWANQRVSVPPGAYELTAVGAEGYEATKWNVETTRLITYTSSFERMMGRPGIVIDLTRGDHVSFAVALEKKSEITEPPPTTPPLAVAPFSAAEAKAHQDAWAKHLGILPEFTNSIGMKLRLIPAGEFMMGTPAAEIEELVRRSAAWTEYNVRSEAPLRRQRIAQPFYLGSHEVTVGQYRAFVNAEGYQTWAERTGKGGRGWDSKQRKLVLKPGFTWNSSFVASSPRHPVVLLHREDIDAFCVWLSKKEDRRYVIPTEEQWEFACRAGTVSRWYWGDDIAEAKQYGWSEDPATGSRQMPVGQRLPNGFGLYDLAGNVAEMTLAKNGAVLWRGGHTGYPPIQLRSAARESENHSDPTYRNGFRVAVIGDLRATTPTEAGP